MDKDAALKLALAFMERVNMEGWVLADFEREMYAAIAAVKEALLGARNAWQGLTDDEIEEFEYKALGTHDLCLEIEAKLQEKNT